MKSTACCGYTPVSDTEWPVFWNPLNAVVQCHNCGQVYEPSRKGEKSLRELPPDYEDLRRAYELSTNRKAFLEDKCASLERALSTAEARFMDLLTKITDRLACAPGPMIISGCPPGYTMVATNALPDGH